MLLASSIALSVGCGRGAEAPKSGAAFYRDEAADSSDPVVVERWLLAELLSPGGESAQAKKARQRLDQLKAQGAWAELARGLDDAEHGRPDLAADAFMRTLSAARTMDDPRAPLLAWYAVQRAQELEDQRPGFFDEWGATIDDILKKPGAIGWRAYGTVVDLWGVHAWDEARADLNDEVARRFGCVENVRLAGPFGDDNAADLSRVFLAEAPGPWPARFEGLPGAVEQPRILESDRVGCDVGADEPVVGGVFYAETFLDIGAGEAPDAAREVVLAVSGAFRIWVNDTLVFERDPRQWGVWPRFGVALRLKPGRHRIVAKLGSPETSMRVVLRDGRPARVSSSSDPAPGYSLVPPGRGSDPNVLLNYVDEGRVIDPEDDPTRFLAANLVSLEGEADVASVLMEPLVEQPSESTGIALTTSARFVEHDPIFDMSQTRDLMHELHLMAAEKDAGLWEPRLAIALWDAEQKGAVAAVKPLEELARQFPQVAAVRFSLARLYGSLGWIPELKREGRKIVEDFPDDPDALGIGIDLYEAEGNRKAVDELLARLVELDPDSEVPLTRALEARDYDKAVAELRRLGARRPDREDIAERIADVMVRAGNTREAWKKLEEAIEKEPRDVHSRLALADARLAQGESAALAQALADAVQAGGSAEIVEEAVDLIDGMTSLEPYRLDARQVIADYEKVGKHLPGTAARVLDYGAVWVRADGSSRMLEHEVIRIQSEEAIDQFAELPRMEGLVLHQRVIKQDGSVLEPELVSGKPTMTMPHLEVGDYIETERIVSDWGDGTGSTWIGPAWFFREENIAYARSEFVVISPSDQSLVIERHHGVPEAEVTEDGPFTIHRFRVDFSPAAPIEPFSPPASEFLPRVWVGWGASFEERLRRTSGSLVDLTPVDPRLQRIAEGIVQNIPRGQTTARARALYRWVLENVEEGGESDGRRVVVSRNGDRARGFLTLCSALGIDVHYALAKSRLALPPTSSLSQASQQLYPVLRFVGERGPVWLTVDDKYAPFGYVPAPFRGQDAYVLQGDSPRRTKVPEGGTLDAIEYSGKGKLGKAGNAELELRLSFGGKFAAALRNGLAEVPENQLHNVIESNLLGNSLQGVRLVDYEIVDVDKLDRPLVIAVQVEVPHFANESGERLLLAPPFMPELGQFASLSQRTTPILLTDATHQSLHLDLELPPGVSVEQMPKPTDLSFGDFQVKVADQAQGQKLTLNREVSLEAGRIQPKDYPKFQAFTRRADDALLAAVRLEK